MSLCRWSAESDLYIWGDDDWHIWYLRNGEPVTVTDEELIPTMEKLRKEGYRIPESAFVAARRHITGHKE